jgi:hypothetical protein
VVIPKIGIAMGEIFYLEELAADCVRPHMMADHGPEQALRGLAAARAA